VIVDAVKLIFANAPFVQYLGVEYLAAGDGWCTARLYIDPVHQQQHGYVHAGVLMTLADHNCGGAAASTVESDSDVITVENKMSFMRPAVGFELWCQAQVLRSGKRLIFTEVEVQFGPESSRQLAAKCQALWL
jgi:uncharacterized protein (TIGR00369 family)